MSDIKELTQWCEEARSLLGYAIGFNDASKDMKEANTKVSEKLASLAKLASQAELSKAFMDEFEVLALEAKRLAQQPKGDKKQEKERISAIKALSGKLASLGDRIVAALPLAKAQDAYRVKLNKCSNLRDNFATQPGADPATLNAVIEQATGLAGAQTDTRALSSAMTMLSSFDGVLETAKSDYKKAAALQKKQTEAKAGCEEKYRLAGLALAFVEEEGVGLGAQKTALTDGIAEARRLQKAGDWISATTVLNDLPSLKACQEAGAKALKKAGEQFPDVKLGQTAIETLKTLVDEDFWKPLDARLWKAIDDIAQPGAGKVEQGMLKGMVDSINDKISWARKAGIELNQALRDLTGAMDHLNIAAPAIETLPIGEGIERVRAFQTQKQLVIGQDLAAELKTSMARLQNDWGTRHQRWLTVKPQLEEMISELGIQAADAKAPQDLRDAATQQKARLGEVRRHSEARDWDTLLRLYESAKDTLAGFAQRKQAYIDFTQQRGNADMKAQSEFTLLQNKLDALTQTLTKAGVAPAKTLAPLDKSLASIKAAWAKKCASAASDGELDLGATLGALAQLEKEALAAGTTEGVDGAKTEQATDALREQFASLQAGLLNPFKILEVLDPKKTVALRARVAAIEADAGASWADRVSAMELAAADVAKAAQTAEKDRNERNSQMRRTCQQLQTTLEEQWNQMKKGPGKKFKGLFDAMRGELADLAMLAETPSLEAAKANQLAITSLETRLRELRTLSPEGADPFQVVIDQLAELKTKFDEQKSDLEANLPKTLISLQKRLKTLEADLYSSEIAKSTGEIAALDTALDQAVDEVQKKVNLRLSVDDLVPQLERSLKMMKDGGLAPDYCKALQQRLDAAIKLAKTPDKLSTARSDMTRLRNEIETAILDPKQALAKQATLQAEAQRKELQLAEWKSGLKAFKAKSLPRAVTATEAPGADPAQVAEVERMIALAEESADAKDIGEALRRLRLAQQRVEEIVADPSGPGIGSRRALPQNARQFAEAAQQLVSALKAFPGQVSAKVEKLPQPALERITSAAASAQGLFDANVFDTYAATLSDGKAEVRSRREARERALEKVRGLVSLLDNHPVLTGLIANPISVDLLLASRLVRQRLASLEANIRRSVH